MVCWRSISSSWRTSFLFLLQSNGGGLSHQRVCAQSPLILVPRTDPNLIQANEKVHRRPLRREMYQVRSVWRFQPMIKEGLGIYLHCHPSFVIQKRPQPSKGSSCHPTRGICFPLAKFSGSEVMYLPYEEGSYPRAMDTTQKDLDEKYRSGEELVKSVDSLASTTRHSWDAKAVEKWTSYPSQGFDPLHEGGHLEEPLTIDNVRGYALYPSL